MWGHREEAGSMNLTERTSQGWLEAGVLVATDIRRYSDRNAADQLLMQLRLESALELAADWLGWNRALWRRQVGGDGELAILPHDVDLCAVVGVFPEMLRAALAQLNGDEDVEHRLRIRLAIHLGTFTSGPLGAVGLAPILVSGILDAQPLRELLEARPEADVVLALSARIFEDVVATGFCALPPQSFQQVQICIKRISSVAYLYDAIPDGADDGPAEAA
jgi:hypothetical protein